MLSRSNYFLMGDAALPSGLNGTSFPAVAGYFGGPNAYNVWSKTQFRSFRGLKLPIWVSGFDGKGEGIDAVAALKTLGVPPQTHGDGTFTAVDMETRRDRTYLANYTAVLNSAGYRVLDYGSLNDVFHDLKLNGYWVADYTDLSTAEDVLAQEGVRAVQFKTGKDYDVSLVKDWVARFLWV